jgi:hypothetical protein
VNPFLLDPPVLAILHEPVPFDPNTYGPTLPVVVFEFVSAFGALQRTVCLEGLEEVEQHFVDRLRLLLLDPVAAIGNYDRAAQFVDHLARA